MKILRIFPRHTSMTPHDSMAFVGDPPLWRPEADEVHISVCFTWDIERAQQIAKAWEQHYPVVKMGGPALFKPMPFDAPFTPGLYVKPGVTFTSRGCNSNCPWCLVPEREGKLRLLEIQPGHIVQDNNLLQTGRAHLRKVFAMLRTQSAIEFSGGLDKRLLTDEIAEELRSLRIHQVFFSCDTKEDIKPLRTAIKKLSLPRQKVRCYVLLKFNLKETLSEATERMIEVWEAGAMPFAQLFQPANQWIDYPNEWRRFARTWSRPAAMKAFMEV